MKDRYVIGAACLLIMAFMALSFTNQRHSIKLLERQVEALTVQRDAAMRRIRAIDRYILPLDVIEKILAEYGDPLDDRER
jgi:hypothetical protein